MNTRKAIVCIQEDTIATATILDAFINPKDEKEIVLIWIIDAGTHKRHKIFDRFYHNTVNGKKRFAKMCEGINYAVEYSDGFDLQRLVGKRAEIQIAYIFSDVRKAWVNIIGSYKITDKKPEFDPFAPEKEDKFYHTYKPKKLPIRADS